MTLDTAHIGEHLRIQQVSGERAFRRRLLELGLVPGTRVELKRVAPLGDPVELLVRGCSLSIRRAEVSGCNVPLFSRARGRFIARPVFRPGVGGEPSLGEQHGVDAVAMSGEQLLT